MELIKSSGFFEPKGVARCHIIGCGSVGSTVADLLARFGLDKISIYDFDVVEEHNIVNQMFTSSDFGLAKVDAVAAHLMDINPAMEGLKIFRNGYTDQKLNGYVFLCVDSIELRRKICEAAKMNNMIKAVFDFRTRLTDAQHFAADWTSPVDRESLLNSMAFTDGEAAEQTPASACGITLGVAPTVRMICNAGVANFVNFVKGQPLKRCIFLDAFNFTLDAF